MRLSILKMEDGSQEQDKYHQLRNAINHLNKEGQHTFVLGKEISFNEGVIPIKSNYNPFRKYSKSKLDE